MNEQPAKYDFPASVTYASVFLSSLIAGVFLFAAVATTISA